MVTTLNVYHPQVTFTKFMIQVRPIFQGWLQEMSKILRMVPLAIVAPIRETGKSPSSYKTKHQRHQKSTRLLKK